MKKKASTRVEQMQLKNMGEEREQGESRVRTLTVVQVGGRSQRISFRKERKRLSKK